MEVYRIRECPNQTFSLIVNGSEIEAAKTLLPINDSVHRKKYGVAIAAVEIALFQLHYLAWNHFKQYGSGGSCLIVDEKVSLKDIPEDIAQKIGELPEGWDVFFPFDKLRARAQERVNDLPMSRLGFFWGYYIYVISKRGVEKMADIRGIRQPVDETMLNMSLRKQIAIVAAPTSWYSFDERKSQAFIARKENAIEAIRQYTVWKKDERDACVRIIRYLADLAESMDKKLFLHCGTLLGAIRHGKIMDWDDDVDLMMEEKEATTLVESIRQQGEYEVSECVWKKTGKKYYKIWHLSGQKAEGYEYTFPFVDIWVLYDDPERHRISTNDDHNFERNIYFPLRAYEFEGVSLYIPNKPFEILDAKYNGWRRSIHVFSWSHRTKRHELASMVVPIKTDGNGRFIDFDR